MVYNDDAISDEKKENPSKGFSKFKNKMGELAKADPETRILFGIEKFKGFYIEKYILLENRNFWKNMKRNAV